MTSFVSQVPSGRAAMRLRMARSTSSWIFAMPWVTWSRALLAIRSATSRQKRPLWKSLTGVIRTASPNIWRDITSKEPGTVSPRSDP